MNFLWKVIFICLWLGIHCCGGLVHNRHDIEKRETNTAPKVWWLPTDFLKTILTPIANLADQIEVNIPGLASYRTEDKND